MSNLYSALDRLTGTGNLSKFLHDQQSLVWRHNNMNREILALYCHDGMCTEDVGYLSLMLRSFDGADKLSLEPGFGIRIKVDLLNKTATPETWGNGATADPNDAGLIASAINECIDRCEHVYGITKVSDVWDMSHSELRRIRQAGYPSILYHEPEGDSRGRIEWWAEDDRGYDLGAAFDSSFYGDNEEEIDLAHKRLVAHWEDIESRTIAALRGQGNVSDLCNLIDAAAKQGEALCPDNAAGWFLRRIAELALSAINTTGDHRND